MAGSSVFKSWLCLPDPHTLHLKWAWHHLSRVVGGVTAVRRVEGLSAGLGQSSHLLSALSAQEEDENVQSSPGDRHLQSGVPHHWGEGALQGARTYAVRHAVEGETGDE